jgi:hypothetical protein
MSYHSLAAGSVRIPQSAQPACQSCWACWLWQSCLMASLYLSTYHWRLVPRIHWAPLLWQHCSGTWQQAAGVPT